MVAEGGEGENPLLFSLTAPKRGGGWGTSVPRTEQISQRVSYFYVFLSFLTRTLAFFEDALWGGGRALVAGGVAAGWRSKRGKSREGLACLAVPQEGARAWGGIQGLRFRKGRCVIF